MAKQTKAKSDQKMTNQKRPTLTKVILTAGVDLKLEPFSNSFLTAVNQCPTWGIIRYGKRRTYSETARALALEAGSVMHRVFATVRLWQLDRIQGQNKR